MAMRDFEVSACWVRGLIAGLLVLLVGACGGGSDNEAPPQNRGIEGLTTEQLAQYQATSDRTSRLGPLFEGQVNEALAGYYIGRSQSNVFSFVLAVSDDRRVVPIDGELPDRIERVKYNIVELDALTDSVKAVVFADRSLGAHSVGPDITRNAVFLGVSIGATDRVLAALDQADIPLVDIAIEESPSPSTGLVPY